jgi:hypothetical protein
MIIEIKECLDDENGAGYLGTQDKTEKNLLCQQWTSQTPHPHGYTISNMFTDGTKKSKNYCRFLMKT